MQTFSAFTFSVYSMTRCAASRYTGPHALNVSQNDKCYLVCYSFVISQMFLNLMIPSILAHRSSRHYFVLKWTEIYWDHFAWHELNETGHDQVFTSIVYVGLTTYLCHRLNIGLARRLRVKLGRESIIPSYLRGYIMPRIATFNYALYIIHWRKQIMIGYFECWKNHAWQM